MIVRIVHSNCRSLNIYAYIINMYSKIYDLKGEFYDDLGILGTRNISKTNRTGGTIYGRKKV